MIYILLISQLLIHTLLHAQQVYTAPYISHNILRGRRKSHHINVIFAYHDIGTTAEVVGGKLKELLLRESLRKTLIISMRSNAILPSDPIWETGEDLSTFSKELLRFDDVLKRAINGTLDNNLLSNIEFTGRFNSIILFGEGLGANFVESLFCFRGALVQAKISINGNLEIPRPLCKFFYDSSLRPSVSSDFHTSDGRRGMNSSFKYIAKIYLGSATQSTTPGAFPYTNLETTANSSTSKFQPLKLLKKKLFKKHFLYSLLYDRKKQDFLFYSSLLGCESNNVPSFTLQLHPVTIPQDLYNSVSKNPFAALLSPPTLSSISFRSIPYFQEKGVDFELLNHYLFENPTLDRFMYPCELPTVFLDQLWFNNYLSSPQLVSEYSTALNSYGYLFSRLYKMMDFSTQFQNNAETIMTEMVNIESYRSFGISMRSRASHFLYHSLANYLSQASIQTLILPSLELLTKRSRKYAKMEKEEREKGAKDLGNEQNPQNQIMTKLVENLAIRRSERRKMSHFTIENKDNTEDRKEREAVEETKEKDLQSEREKRNRKGTVDATIRYAMGEQIDSHVLTIQSERDNVPRKISENITEENVLAERQNIHTNFNHSSIYNLSIEPQKPSRIGKMWQDEPTHSSCQLISQAHIPVSQNASRANIPNLVLKECTEAAALHIPEDFLSSNEKEIYKERTLRENLKNIRNTAKGDTKTIKYLNGHTFTFSDAIRTVRYCLSQSNCTASRLSASGINGSNLGAPQSYWLDAIDDFTLEELNYFISLNKKSLLIPFITKKNPSYETTLESGFPSGGINASGGGSNGGNVNTSGKSAVFTLGKLSSSSTKKGELIDDVLVDFNAVESSGNSGDWNSSEQHILKSSPIPFRNLLNILPHAPREYANVDYNGGEGKGGISSIITPTKKELLHFYKVHEIGQPNLKLLSTPTSPQLDDPKKITGFAIELSEMSSPLTPFVPVDERDSENEDQEIEDAKQDKIEDANIDYLESLYIPKVSKTNSIFAREIKQIQNRFDYRQNYFFVSKSVHLPDLYSDDRSFKSISESVSAQGILLFQPHAYSNVMQYHFSPVKIHGMQKAPLAKEANLGESLLTRIITPPKKIFQQYKEAQNALVNDENVTICAYCKTLDLRSEIRMRYLAEETKAGQKKEENEKEEEKRLRKEKERCISVCKKYLQKKLTLSGVAEEDEIAAIDHSMLMSIFRSTLVQVDRQKNFYENYIASAVLLPHEWAVLDAPLSLSYENIDDNFVFDDVMIEEGSDDEKFTQKGHCTVGDKNCKGGKDDYGGKNSKVKPNMNNILIQMVEDDLNEKKRKIESRSNPVYSKKEHQGESKYNLSFQQRVQAVTENLLVATQLLPDDPFLSSLYQTAIQDPPAFQKTIALFFQARKDTMLIVRMWNMVYHYQQSHSDFIRRYVRTSTSSTENSYDEMRSWHYSLNYNLQYLWSFMLSTVGLHPQKLSIGGGILLPNENEIFLFCLVRLINLDNKRHLSTRSRLKKRETAVFNNPRIRKGILKSLHISSMGYRSTLSSLQSYVFKVWNLPSVSVEPMLSDDQKAERKEERKEERKTMVNFNPFSSLAPAAQILGFNYSCHSIGNSAVQSNASASNLLPFFGDYTLREGRDGNESMAWGEDPLDHNSSCRIPSIDTSFQNRLSLKFNGKEFGSLRGKHRKSKSEKKNKSFLEKILHGEKRYEVKLDNIEPGSSAFVNDLSIMMMLIIDRSLDVAHASKNAVLDTSTDVSPTAGEKNNPLQPNLALRLRRISPKTDSCNDAVNGKSNSAGDTGGREHEMEHGSPSQKPIIARDNNSEQGGLLENTNLEKNCKKAEALRKKDQKQSLDVKDVATRKGQHSVSVPITATSTLSSSRRKSSSPLSKLRESSHLGFTGGQLDTWLDIISPPICTEDERLYGTTMSAFESSNICTSSCCQKRMNDNSPEEETPSPMLYDCGEHDNSSIKLFPQFSSKKNELASISLPKYGGLERDENLLDEKKEGENKNKPSNYDVKIERVLDAEMVKQGFSFLCHRSQSNGFSDNPSPTFFNDDLSNALVRDPPSKNTRSFIADYCDKGTFGDIRDGKLSPNTSNHSIHSDGNTGLPSHANCSTNKDEKKPIVKHETIAFGQKLKLDYGEEGAQEDAWNVPKIYLSTNGPDGGNDARRSETPLAGSHSPVKPSLFSRLKCEVPINNLKKEEPVALSTDFGLSLPNKSLPSTSVDYMHRSVYTSTPRDSFAYRRKAWEAFLLVPIQNYYFLVKNNLDTLFFQDGKWNMIVTAQHTNDRVPKRKKAKSISPEVVSSSSPTSPNTFSSSFTMNKKSLLFNAYRKATTLVHYNLEGNKRVKRFLLSPNHSVHSIFSKISPLSIFTLPHYGLGLQYDSTNENLFEVLSRAVKKESIESKDLMIDPAQSIKNASNKARLYETLSEEFEFHPDNVLHPKFPRSSQFFYDFSSSSRIKVYLNPSPVDPTKQKSDSPGGVKEDIEGEVRGAKEGMRVVEEPSGGEEKNEERREEIDEKSDERDLIENNLWGNTLQKMIPHDNLMQYCPIKNYGINKYIERISVYLSQTSADSPTVARSVVSPPLNPLASPSNGTTSTKPTYQSIGGLQDMESTIAKNLSSPSLWASNFLVKFHSYFQRTKKHFLQSIRKKVLLLHNESFLKLVIHVLNKNFDLRVSSRNFFISIRKLDSAFHAQAVEECFTRSVDFLILLLSIPILLDNVLLRNVLFQSIAFNPLAKPIFAAPLKGEGQLPTVSPSPLLPPISPISSFHNLMTKKSHFHFNNNYKLISFFLQILSEHKLLSVSGMSNQTFSPPIPQNMIPYILSDHVNEKHFSLSMMNKVAYYFFQWLLSSNHASVLSIIALQLSPNPSSSIYLSTPLTQIWSYEKSDMTSIYYPVKGYFESRVKRHQDYGMQSANEESSLHHLLQEKKELNLSPSIETCEFIPLDVILHTLASTLREEEHKKSRSCNIKKFLCTTLCQSFSNLWRKKTSCNSSSNPNNQNIKSKIIQQLIKALQSYSKTTRQVLSSNYANVPQDQVLLYNAEIQDKVLLYSLLKANHIDINTVPIYCPLSKIYDTLVLTKLLVDFLPFAFPLLHI